MQNPAYYAKAIWAFLGTAVGACIAVIAATPHHSFGDLDTLAWLTLIATVLGVPLGTYAIPNKGKATVSHTNKGAVISTTTAPATRTTPTAPKGRSEKGQSALFVILIVLCILAFGLGFVVKWLLIVAIVLLLLALIEGLVWHPRSRR